MAAVVGVVVFPGSNCELDVVEAVRSLGGEGKLLWHGDSSLGGVDAVVLPGGFAHGDYLRPGAIARFSPIMQAVGEHATAGGPVVGICNGFQVLCEAGLLPGALVKNRSMQFQGETVRVRVDNNETMFTNLYDRNEILDLHIAHGVGNYLADEESLARLEGDGPIVFRYVDERGVPSDAGNANGSMHNIAGIVNEEGNVLGMMPHPERSVESLLGSTDGLPIFQSLAAHLSGTGVA